MERRREPVCLILTRQAAPSLEIVLVDKLARCR
jgi:hypothetical protein